MTATMRKLPRTSMRSWMVKHLKQEQGGLCLLCGQAIDITVKGEGVVDHDHTSGEIRGVLHRSCNAAEGKVANAAGRWGAKSMEYSAILPFLKRLVAYLERTGVGLIYHGHKTEDEQRLARNAKARKTRAEAKARGIVRGSRPTKTE